MNQNTALSPIIAGEIVSVSAPAGNPYRRFFDFEAAEQKVYNHVLTLSGGKPDPKTGKPGPTMRAYRRDLALFIRFLGNDLPSEDLVTRYIASLSHLRSKTIDRYLTPARLFMRNLAAQPLNFEHINDARQMFTLIEMQKAIAAAAAVRGIPSDEKNYEGAVHKGVWLSKEQIITLLGSINRSTLKGKRDYALFMIAFNTALRIAEIQRLTRSSFQLLDSETYLISVRGKRNNTTRVPCPKHAYDALMDYIDAYNAAIPAVDPRLIGKDEAVWRYIHKSGQVPTSYHEPIKTRALSYIVEQRSAAAGRQISPHDARRSAALLARKVGMPDKLIQVMLRHASVATTEKYMGEEKDWHGATLTAYGCVLA